MEYLSVLLAAVAAYAFGAIWYMRLAGPWVEAAGIEVDENGRPANSSPVPFIISFVAMIVVAGMMRHMFAMAGIDGAIKGLVSGLGVGLFFISPWIVTNYAYSDRPRNLSLIDCGYAIGGTTVMGLILGIF